jgi:hypothetical protein
MNTQSTLRAAALAILVASSPGLGAVRYVWQGSPSPGPPYGTWANAAHDIQTAVDVAVTGDEIVVTNGIYAAGGRAVFGTMTNRVAVDKPLTVRSVNGPEFTWIQGSPAPGGGNGDGAIRCVYLTNGALLSGFTLINGATRTGGDFAREQCAGGIWCESAKSVVSNCVLRGNSAVSYGGGAYGGTLNSCTVVSNSAYNGGGVYASTLNNCTLSGNSALYIVGYQAGRGGGAASATLNNCTLTGNSGHYGGGADGGVLNSCVLSNNSAPSNWLDMYSGTGGGTSGSTLRNCLVRGNSAEFFGGGAAGGMLNNCTVSANSVSYSVGGGAWNATLNNCILYYNNGPIGGDGSNYWYCTMNYCCSTPLPAGGIGNITNAPLFVNQAGGNLRLQSGSPCIDAGNNSYVAGLTALDGRPRLIGSVDMGAYEFQGPFNTWLQQYGLPADGSADFVDTDGDGHNNYQEWRCLTVPTSALSALRLLSAVPTGADVAITWHSVASVSYFLERCTNLAASPVFTRIATNLPGLPTETTYTDTNAASPTPLFYRVGVGN